MSKKFKTLCATVCTVLLLLSMCFSASAEFLAGAQLPSLSDSPTSAVPVYLNGSSVDGAIKIGALTYVPLLDFSRELLDQNCELSWDSDSGKLLLSSDSVQLSFDLVNDFIEVNDRCLPLNASVCRIDSEIYVPIRPLCRALAAPLRWDSRSGAVFLSHSPGALITSGGEFYDEGELFWLSRVISAESRNQSFAGMIGVGNVVLNRVKEDSGRFPDSVYEVIFQPGQFSVVDAGSIYSAPDPICVSAAKLCLEGVNTVGSSLFFLNPSISDSTWFDANLCFWGAIGDHYFYA